MEFRNYISRRNVNLGFIADQLELPSVGGLNKHELINRIVKEFLSPETLRRWLSVLDDQTFELWEKSAETPFSYSSNSVEEKQARVLADMHLARIEYAPYAERLVLTSFRDVWQVYKESIAGEEFTVARKKMSWVWKCLGWANEVYMYTPKAVFLELVNVNKLLQISARELDDMIKPVPPFSKKVDVLGDVLVCPCRLSDDFETVEDALVKQGKIGFYIPTIEELEEYIELEAIVSKKPYQDLRLFLTDERGVTEANAEQIIEDLWREISYGWGNVAISDLLNSIDYDPEDVETINKLIKSYWATCSVTNSRFHRGYTEYDILSGNYKTIPAQFSLPDEYYGEKSIPSTEWGFNDDGSTYVLGGKIYANDPCPCGSGLKYKKCCGNPKKRSFQ